MRGTTGFGMARFGRTHVSLFFACLCVLMLAAGCSKSEKSDGALDTRRLPRVVGAKEVFASPASTIFTTSTPVAQTADAVDKALAVEGWQKYVPPHTSLLQNDSQRTLSLKKGPQALGVFITVAPAQGNATSVQYNLATLKNDVPFPQDASNIEFDPNKPLLMLVSAEPIDKTLDFYRKELALLGWALWSQKLNGVQPAGGTSGELTKSGAYAYYLQGDRRLAALVLERAEAGRIKVKFEEMPPGYLEALQKEFFNSDNIGAALVDVGRLPRLEGASVDAARSSTDSLVYSVVGSLAKTVAATRQMLAADGWKQYVAPLESHDTLLAFKKGPQGLSVSYTIQVGKNDQTSEVITVYYSPTRLRYALAIPGDATDVVFDENRPYLNCITAGTIEATADFYRKELGALGWLPLSAADAGKQWPNAKLDDRTAKGVSAYYIRGTQRPIQVSLQSRDDNRTAVEIKVPPFAEPQVLEAGQDIFGLPRPKDSKTAGGTGGETEHTVYAHVPAELGTVLAFYRRELVARNWKEETQGAVLKPDEVVVNFTSPDGPAVLKLGRKYDLTIASLVLRIQKPAAAKAEPASGGDSVDALMKQAQQMMREAAADLAVGTKSAAAPPPPNAAAPPLHVLAKKKWVGVPEGAEDVAFDGTEGTLEYSTASGIQSVADFHRSTMKAQGWDSRPSVINNANMVVLNFAKAGKSVSFTIMRMGNTTRVSAEGSGLKVAAGNVPDATPANVPGATPANAPSATATSTPDATPANANTPNAAPANTSKAANAPVQASAEELEAEESGGLPLPRRHTMSEGTKTPFRRELKASVPLELTDVLGFYRRELGKLKWNEAAGAKVAADSATIAFTSPDGPATLRLGRKDGETSVSLAMKNPGAVAKAGIMPKPGQAKVIFGNINSAAETITFNNKAISVAAGAGTKSPDGPALDVAPGKYRYSVKLPGKPAQADDVELGADETWGLMIGPGGVLALQAY
ncbi:MAG TPA: hypothetical protein VIV34_13050 [Pseudolabrys sp.]